MHFNKYQVPAFIKRRYLGIQERLSKLETSVRYLDVALDALTVSPRYVPGNKIGFNGQLHRKRIFCDIVAAISPDIIIEMGTFLGDTTGFMAETARKPIFSCEANLRFRALAKMRLSGKNEIHLELGDKTQR